MRLVYVEILTRFVIVSDVCITHEEALGIIKLIPTSNVSPCGTGASSALDFCMFSALTLSRNCFMPSDM